MQRRTVLRKFCGLLAPGGAVLLDVEKRYADVAGLTYNPEHTEFAVVARKR